MIPRELLGTAPIPGGNELRLFRHGRDFMISLDSNELMNTRTFGSEEALANMTCERLGQRKAQHWLIGGYGMGFTLRAALAALGDDAKITVAELVPEIIEWARGPMQDLTDGCLGDPRVDLDYDDVFAVICDAQAQAQVPGGQGVYDAILLDVDNGPDGLVRPENNRLYAMRGLRAAKAALKPDGVLAIWSAARDPAFMRKLGDAGFDVDEVRVRARSNGKGAHHVIWFARARQS